MSNDQCIILGAICSNNAEEVQYFTVPFLFENENVYEEHYYNSFSELYDHFSQWLTDRGRPGWFSVSILEKEDEASIGDTINPVYISE